MEKETKKIEKMVAILRNGKNHSGYTLQEIFKLGTAKLTTVKRQLSPGERKVINELKPREALHILSHTAISLNGRKKCMERFWVD